MSSKSLAAYAGYVVSVGMSIGALLIVIAATWIGYEVKKNCKHAQNKFSGDCVEALSQMVRDDTQSFTTRNDAVWSLGQLGDPRALPVLEASFTGNIPDREPYNEVLSQYELRKAIHLAKGSTNIFAWVWRQ